MSSWVETNRRKQNTWENKMLKKQINVVDRNLKIYQLHRLHKDEKGFENQVLVWQDPGSQCKPNNMIAQKLKNIPYNCQNKKRY